MDLAHEWTEVNDAPDVSQVSILVLMDLAHECVLSQVHKVPEPVFQSLF